MAVGGRRVPLIGRVSMDMLTVDLTELPSARVGTEVELWGGDVPVGEVAARAGTIAYELLCNAKRAPKRYVGLQVQRGVEASQNGLAALATAPHMNDHPTLDRVDLRILCQLQKNGRITNVDLADAVCLSPSPCLVRLKRLEQAGYVAGYGAQIRLDKLGDTLTVFTEVTLADHRPEDFSRFEACIRPIDDIVECHLVSGGYDYLLKLITRGIDHY